MCNHYRCNDDEEMAHRIEREFSHTAIRPLAVSRPRLPRERWPRKPALIVVEQAGDVAIEEVRWGVWPFYVRAKPQFITNARGDGLLSKAITGT